MKKVLFTGALALGIVACGVTAFAVDVGTPVWPSETKSGQVVKVDSNIPPAQGPSADACPDVVQPLLSSAGGTIAADTTGMVDDWDESGCGSCSYGGGSPDEVHEITVDATGVWEFTTCGASNGGVAPFDTSIQVRRADAGCSDSCCVGCDGDACGGAGNWGSTFSACLNAGETYYLIVDGWNAGSFGPVTLDYANLGPCGDPCPGLVAEGMLLAAGGTVTGDSTGASNDIENDGASCGFYGSGAEDVIHEFTVEASGTWTFDTCASTTAFDTSLMIRGLDAAACVAGCPGDWIACNGDQGCAGFLSTVSGTLLAGETYYLVVDGYSAGQAGPYEVIYSRVGCTSDLDCDDGLVCNGAETCDVGAGACLPGVDIVCEAFEDCDEVGGGCVSAADPCVSWWGGRTSSGYFFPGANAGLGNRVADDISLATGAGHELISYTLPLIARGITGVIGDPYTITTELWSADPATCGPLAPIAGTQCVFTDNLDAGGSPADVFVCAPNGGAGTGVMIPRGGAAECGIDAYVVYDAGLTEGGVGFSIAGSNQAIGEPGLEDFSQPEGLFAIEDGPGAGTFGLTWFGAGLYADFWDMQVCTQEAIGACCTVIDFATACLPDMTFNDCEAVTGFASWTAFAACPSDCASADYCASNWATGFDWIANVTLTDVNNDTVDDAGGYGDYTGMTAALKVGATNQVSVTVDNAGFESNVGVWIDWNHDFSFDDANEAYDLGTTPTNGGTMTMMITPPAGALLGATTMRVIEADTFEAVPGPCSVGSFGETEDYTIDLVEAICADGVVDPGEDCDPGADVATDCCAADCSYDTGSVCRGAVDGCDVDETCPGGTDACPADVFNTGADCGAAATQCSDQDTCNASGGCDANDLANGTACGAAGDECSDQDTCDGAGSCSNLNHLADGTACGRAATECHVQDGCLGGACDPAPFFDCGPTDGCCPPGCGPRDHDLDCGDAVPTVSTWGLVILAMLLLVAMKVHFGRRRSVA